MTGDKMQGGKEINQSLWEGLQAELVSLSAEASGAAETLMGAIPFALNAVGELSKSKVSLVFLEVILGLQVFTAACGPSVVVPGVEIRTDNGAVATEAVGVTAIPSPTLDVEKFRGVDVKLELITDSEKLAAKSKEFAEGALISQILEINQSGNSVVKESSVDKPGLGEKYNVLSVFEVKGTDGVVKDEFYRIRSMNGEQFLVIKLKNTETNENEFVRLQAGKDIQITGQPGIFVPMLYFDQAEDGSIEYYYPLAFGKDDKGFTGQAVYGEDLDIYSLMSLGNAFTVKNAMLLPQLESTMAEIDQQLKNQGITEYNYGIDEKGGGFKVYGADGRELIEIDGKWMAELPGTIAGVETTQYGFDVGELVLNDKNEIVDVATGEVVAIMDKDGVRRFVYGPYLIEHLHKVAKLGKIVNGEQDPDSKIQEHIGKVMWNIPHTVSPDPLISRKDNGYIESYSWAWFQPDNNADIMNNDPHDGTLWVEPPAHEGDNLEGLIKIKVTQWVNPVKY